MDKVRRLESTLENSDCAIIHVTLDPLRYVVAKKFKNGWVVRSVKGEVFLTEKQVLNGKCKSNVKIKDKMTKQKAINLLKNIKVKGDAVFMRKGKQWKKNDLIEGIDYINNNYIFQAVNSGELRNVQEAYQLNLNLNFKDEEGNTPLHYAASLENIKITEFLINKGVKINTVNKLGEYPIHNTYDSKVLKILLKNGSKINVRDNIDKSSPLMKNIVVEDMDSIKLLIKNKANVNTKKDDGVTPLMYACSLGNLELVKLLIKNKAKINVKDKKHESPLSNAVLYNYPSIVKFLLTKKAVITERTKQNAILNGDKEMLKLFNLKSPKKIRKTCGKNKGDDYVCNPLSGKWVMKSGSAGKIIMFCCES